MFASKQEKTIIEGANTVLVNIIETIEAKWYRKIFVFGSIIDIILIFFIVVVMGLLTQSGYLPHMNQGFRCQDPKISYPYSTDLIRTPVLLLIAFFSPILIMKTVESLRSDGNSFRKICLWYRGYCIGMLCAVAFMLILRVSTGEPRPYFLYVCEPDAAKNCTKDEYITEYLCLNTRGFATHIVTDSSLSFPSAHATIGCFNSIFCVMYIHMRFNVRYMGVLLKPLVISLVSTWGFFVGITRIMDNRHHWWDVAVGFAIGIVFAFYTILSHCDSFNVPTDEKNKKKITCEGTTYDTNVTLSSLNNQSIQLSENNVLLNRIK